MSLVQSLVRPMVSPLAMAMQAKSSGGVVPLPDPTTVSFTAAQVAQGFSGPVSTTKNAARIYGRGQMTLWSGFISGTEAKVNMTSDYGDFDGAVQVSVDGGSFVDAPRATQTFTLFTGLPHAAHFVQFRYAGGLGDVPYIASSGNVMTVTGRPPALQTLNNKIQLGADSALGLYSGAIVPNAAGYTPSLAAPKGAVYGSNVNSVKIKGAFTKMVVTLNGTRKVGVSQNGGPATFYTMAEEAAFPCAALVIPCDGSTSTYNVWDDGNYLNTGGAFCVATDSAFMDIGTRRRLDQYGDSITFGSGPGATSADTETMRVAAALGFVGSTNGISGLTVQAGNTMLDAVLPLRTVNGNDVAIYALGGNNAQDGFDDTEKAAYSLGLDKLLAKAYGKVLCRGILPNISAQPLVDATNAIIKAVVVAKNDPRLIWVDPTTWAFTTVDGTHPDAHGYTDIAGHAIADYAPLLGL